MSRSEITRDDAEVKTLIDSLPTGEDHVLQAVVGALTAPPVHSASAQAALPAIVVDQHLTFTLKEFVAASAREACEGRGMLDEHRALN